MSDYTDPELSRLDAKARAQDRLIKRLADSYLAIARRNHLARRATFREYVTLLPGRVAVTQRVWPR